MRLALLLLMPLTAFADLTVTGTIIDDDNASAYFTGTLHEPTCSDAAIDSAITAASSGDIIRMASACSSMTVSLAFPSTKGVLFDGNGSTFNNSSSIDLDPNATTSTRLTNFSFGCSDANSGGGIEIGGETTTAPWRVDNVTLTGGSHRCILTRRGFGLMDHVSGPSFGAGHEGIHNEAAFTPCSLSGDTYDQCGWDTALTPGSQEFIYYEDNTFGCSPTCSNPAWMQSYYGARVVTRYNTFGYMLIDNHGTGGMIGGRWWESYDNVFEINGGTNSDRNTHNLRAGSGIVFGNAKDSGDLGGVGLCEEDTEGEDPYPAAYQIGRGEDGALYPAYVFDNDTMAVGGCSDAANNGTVTEDVDYYTDIGASCSAGGACTSGIGSGTTLPTTCTTNTGFWKTDEGGNWNTLGGDANDGLLYKCTATDTWSEYFTPLVYPHPLQTGLEPDK